MKDDMIGRRFGRLTVLEYDHPGRNGPYYLCECDCGNQKVVSKNNLKTGNSTSCGCKRRLDDVIGRRFGRLQVINFSHAGKYDTSYYLCECDCGNDTLVSRRHLLDGHVKSCGCWNVDSHKTHGMSDTDLHHTWVSMRQRCNNEKHDSYPSYGGRGIEVCSEWETFEKFSEWAHNNGYRPGLTIDRIDNDCGYSPENCRIADRLTQANNRRTNRFITYGGDTHTIAEWARLFEVKYPTLLYRINRGDMSDFEEYFGNTEV